MQKHAPDIPKPRGKRRRKGFFALICLSGMLGAMVGALFWLQGREIKAPDWLKERVVAELGGVLPDSEILVGDVGITLGDDWRPRFAARDLQLVSADGGDILSVSYVLAGLDRTALIDRRIELRSLDASGVFVSLRRTPEGAVSLVSSERTDAVRRQAPSLLQLVGQLDEFLLQPGFLVLESIDVRAVTLRFEDMRANRAWTIDGGRLRLDRSGEQVQLAADLAVLGGASGVATLSANYAGTLGDQAAEFGITFANLDARDVATQGPEFEWLQVVQAPISGALRGGVSEDGVFSPLNATFQIGAGVIQPTPEASPIPIEGARSYFSYLPQQRLLRFDEFSIDSQWGQGRLEGQALLGVNDDAQLEDLVGQFRLSGLRINPADLYGDPVEIAAAELDFRMRLSPFVVDVGRFQLSDQGKVLHASGSVSAGPQGWDVSLDGELDELEARRLVTLWPEKLKPKTRRWIDENVKGGQIKEATAAVRIIQGGKPRLALGFDFENADFTFLRTMPPVHGARGHASLVKDRFVLIFDDGGVTAPEGGYVDAAGTSFIVPDTTAKPDPPGIVRLAAQGSVTAALSLLDQPPLQVMQKVGLPVAVVKGNADVAGTISLPLKKNAPVEEVSFDVAGTVSDAQSTRLIKGRQLVAPSLALAASEGGVQVQGKGTLDGVPLNVVWQQQLGRPGDILPGQVTGDVEITQEALEAFGITLPPGTVQGSGRGRINMDMLKGTQPRLTVQSDLLGLQLSVPPIGWRKSETQAAQFEIDLTLGEAPVVERLALDAPGLFAVGSVSLTEEAQLERVRLDELRVGGWLDAPVDLVGQGPGNPVSVILRGGRLDLRELDLPAGGSSRRESGPLTVTLDRVQVTDGVSLTDVRGDFSTTGGLSGAFSGAINGRAPVSGTLTPQEGRSAVRLTAPDAGQVLAAAGVMTQAKGGALDLALRPVGTEGAFDGQLKVKDARITEAPTIAALLNSISVVGLINELNGDGIFFSEINADFRLAPSRITLREASATGASMGLSMDGVFEPASGRIQMQGVISPIYMLNAIGSVLTRPGEGLFGFNYSIGGTTDDPQVYVNPLTALAPGMFRNLFRRELPDVPLEEGETAPDPEPRRVPLVTRGEDR